MRYLMIGILSLLGVFCRYWIGVFSIRHWPIEFPLATFVINVLGSFFIALAYVASFERNLLSEDLRVALMVGFFGGFTTFSSFSLESVRLLETGRSLLGLLYAILSPSLCIGVAYLGLFIGRYCFSK